MVVKFFIMLWKQTVAHDTNSSSVGFRKSNDLRMECQQGPRLLAQCCFLIVLEDQLLRNNFPPFTLNGETIFSLLLQAMNVLPCNCFEVLLFRGFLQDHQQVSILYLDKAFSHYTSLENFARLLQELKDMEDSFGNDSLVDRHFNLLQLFCTLVSCEAFSHFEITEIGRTINEWLTAWWRLAQGSNVSKKFDRTYLHFQLALKSLFYWLEKRGRTLILFEQFKSLWRKMKQYVEEKGSKDTECYDCLKVFMGIVSGTPQNLRFQLGFLVADKTWWQLLLETL